VISRPVGEREPDPVIPLLHALVCGKQPPLAWVVRWGAEEREPVAAAWWEQPEAGPLLGVLLYGRQRRPLVRALCGLARLLTVGDREATQTIEAAEMWSRRALCLAEVREWVAWLDGLPRDRGTDEHHYRGRVAAIYAGRGAFALEEQPHALDLKTTVDCVLGCAVAEHGDTAMCDAIRRAVPTPPTLADLLAALPSRG
jgi:hypothetical protein